MAMMGGGGTSPASRRALRAEAFYIPSLNAQSHYAPTLNAQSDYRATLTGSTSTPAPSR
jgi:hypothetical protein